MVKYLKLVGDDWGLPASQWRARHGVGLCYETGNTVDLRKKIGGLVADEALRGEMSVRGRAAVLEHFSYDAVARKAETLMRQAMAARHSVT